MEYVHIVFDTFANSIVIVVDDLNVAKAIANMDSSLVVIPNQPIILCHNIAAYEPKES